MSNKEESVRINKYLSQNGVCSRRQADAMIEEGRVLIEGMKAKPGDRVFPGDEVTVDSKRVKEDDDRVVLAFHKPVGVIVTERDPKAEGKPIMECIDYPKRVFPVGRLDRDSSGLILLTNDGELANRIQMARYAHEKEYWVTVDQEITEEFVTKMSEGVEILGTVTRKCQVKKTGKRTFVIILTQGMNRQIRRMCEALGYRVEHLERVRVMNVELGNLPVGKWRELEDRELIGLLKGVGMIQ